MPKDRRTLLKEWLDDVGGWDAFTAEREVWIRTGLDEETAHWKAAKQIGYPGHAPPPKASRRPVAAPGGVSEGFGGGGGIRGDFDWVYRHVSVETVTAMDAPSSGAWGLLQFARSDPRAFFTKWMDIASRQDDREQLMEGFREDSKKRTDEIAEMLRSFRGARDDGQGGDLADAVDVTAAEDPEAGERNDDVADPHVVEGGDPGLIG